jgi:hypothetical protein
MRKKKDSSENRQKVLSEEAKKFQMLVDKILSVPKLEIHKRKAEYKKRKGKTVKPVQ